MKKILLLLSLLMSVMTFAQNKGITYQAVIYSANGESVPGVKNTSAPLANQSICLQFNIVDDLSQTEYQEKIAVTTDEFGMVNLVIGNGTQTGGYASSFDGIVWTNSKKSLKVSLDQSGSCYNFYEISNQLLTYVPFSLSANSATNVSGIVGIAHGGTNATTVAGAKANLQLQNVDNTSDSNKPLSIASQNALALKVDKVVGKGLSTEDFTTAEKAKLASLGSTPDLSGYATTSSLTDAVTNKFVDLTTNQTVAGKKIFSSDIVVNGLTVGKGKGQNDQNTAIGAGALNASNANGTRNTAVGAGALQNYSGTTFDNNTGVGYFNMIGLTTGYGNTSLGAETMFNVGATSNNTAIGNQSLINVAGDNNVGVGARSGDGLTTGTNNTFIGTQARTLSSSPTISNATALGYGAVVSESNTIQLGDTNITSIKTKGKITTGTITLPNTDGTSGQVLSTNGSGVISWTSPSSANTSNLVDLTTNQTIAGNKTLSGITTVSNNTASTAISNGALVVAGGTGIAGNLNVGGITTITNSTASSAVTNGALVVTGGAGISGNVNVGGNETISGSLGVGTTATNSSAALEVNSTTKGILFPRVTLAQRDLIASPAKGLVVMCLDCGQTGGELGELQVFNGSRWTNAVGTDASGVSAGVGVPAIGSSFQGGLVAYILAPTDPGYEVGKIKGLIVTPADISSAAGIRYDAGTAILGINNSGTAIGTGLSNTIASYNAYGSVNRSIPKIAMDYSVVENGVTYDDWYIPSRDELLKIHANKALLGSFPSTRGYWSSSLWTNSQALTMVVFSDTRGYYGGDGTDDGRDRVRFVRSFSVPIQTTITATNFNGNATSATNVSGVVAIANGGTGATTATGAINALLPSQTSANGKVLTSDGTNVSWSSPGGNTHYVGESYGGGIVFYTYDNGAHGLIVATSEIGDLGPESSSSTTGITFGGSGTWTGAYRYGVGGGLENTNVIISKNSNTGTQYFNYSRTTSTLYAALSASQYLPGGTQSMYYGDWYLPSKGELEILWNNRLLITGSGYNSAHEYWSSTETNESYAYKLQTNGGVGWTPKTTLCFVLPIRKF